MPWWYFTGSFSIYILGRIRSTVDFSFKTYFNFSKKKSSRRIDPSRGISEKLLPNTSKEFWGPGAKNLDALPFRVVSGYLQMRWDWRYAEPMPSKDPKSLGIFSGSVSSFTLGGIESTRIFFFLGLTNHQKTLFVHIIKPGNTLVSVQFLGTCKCVGISGTPSQCPRKTQNPLGYLVVQFRHLPWEGSNRLRFLFLFFRT